MFLVAGLYTSKILAWYHVVNKFNAVKTSNPQRFIEASKTYGLALSLDGLILTRINL